MTDALTRAAEATAVQDRFAHTLERQKRSPTWSAMVDAGFRFVLVDTTNLTAWRKELPAGCLDVGFHPERHRPSIMVRDQSGQIVEVVDIVDVQSFDELMRLAEQMQKPTTSGTRNA